MPFATSILVPVDFSSKSEIATRYACEIARFTSGRLHFLNVVEPPYDFSSRIEKFVEVKKQENAQKLEMLIDDLHSVDDFRFIMMKGRVEVGKTGTALLEAAKSGQYDLISVGLGGEPDLKKALYGSITNNLLLESPVPVFAISKRIDYRPPKHLVFATALRDGDIKPIKKIKRFSKDVGSPLRIVHIVEKYNEIDQQKVDQYTRSIRNKLEDETIEIECFEGEDFLEGITKYIGYDQQTILAITRYRKKFFEWLFANSTIRSVAQIAAVPLLMLPVE